MRWTLAVVAAMATPLLLIPSAAAGAIGGGERDGEVAVYSSLLTLVTKKTEPAFALMVRADDGEVLLLQFRLLSVIPHADLNADGYYQPGEAVDRLVAKSWKADSPSVEIGDNGQVATASVSGSLDLVRSGGPVRDLAKVTLEASVADHDRSYGDLTASAESDARLRTKVEILVPGSLSGIVLDFALVEAPQQESGRTISAPGPSGQVKLRSSVDSPPVTVPRAVSGYEVSFSSDSDSYARLALPAEAVSEPSGLAVYATHWSEGGVVHLALAYGLGPAVTEFHHDPVVGIRPQSDLVRGIRSAADTLARNLPAFGGGIAVAAVVLLVLTLRAGRRVPELDLRSHPRWRGPKDEPAGIVEKPAGPAGPQS